MVADDGADQATLRGVLTSLTAFVPILAATLTFITYSLTGHSLDPATIFSSLQLFNNIRAPLFFLPLVAAAVRNPPHPFPHVG